MSNYGVTINGTYAKTKKAVKEAATAGGAGLSLRNFAFLGAPKPEGPAAELPDGRYAFVGPDPERDRKFYGTLVKTGSTFKVE